jgi:hypothetical protein
MVHPSFYESADLGWQVVAPPRGPGARPSNHLYPVKDAAGKTSRLLVVASGYLRAFDLDLSKVGL